MSFLEPFVQRMVRPEQRQHASDRGPRTLDFDGDHSLYLALREGNAVYRMDLSSMTLHHLAGTGKKGYAGDGGPARQALLAGPKGIALGPGGDVYLADTESHTIRVIRAATGIIETIVGDGQEGDGPDGDPLRCRLSRPHGVFVDSAGVVYIGDSGNHKVRRFTPSKVNPSRSPGCSSFWGHRPEQLLAPTVREGPPRCSLPSVFPSLTVGASAFHFDVQPAQR